MKSHFLRYSAGKAQLFHNPLVSSPDTKDTERVFRTRELLPLHRSIAPSLPDQLKLPAVRSYSTQMMDSM